tara:strand:+ start:1537 stop:1782 length:246 start_codon:yes stop_codon:yes gene_type:complete
MRLPNKKLFTWIWAVSLAVFGFIISTTAYNGTLTFNDEIVKLSLFKSVLAGSIFFLASFALTSFITFILYSIFEDEQEHRN